MDIASILWKTYIVSQINELHINIILEKLYIIIIIEDILILYMQANIETCKPFKTKFRLAILCDIL